MKIFKVLIYMLIFALLLYMSLFFKSYYLFMGTAFMIFAALSDIILYLLPFGSIGIEISSNKTNYTKGEKGEIYITLKNRKCFPINKAKLDITVKNKFYKEHKTTLVVSLPVLASKKITLPFELVKSGVVDISAGNIEYSDMFGIFTSVIQNKTLYSVITMPKNHNIDNAVLGSAESEEIPAVNVYLSNSGDVSGYKEYKSGDKTNSINWKLFARTEKLYVREFERTSADEAVVLMDMNIESLDYAIDTVYSIGLKACNFTLLWLPCGSEEFESAYISGEESLTNALYRIYNSAPEIIKDKALSEYKRLYRENKVLYINDKMELV